MTDNLDRLKHRVQMVLGKALIKDVDDSGEIQLVKVEGFSGEIQDGLERIQEYGVSSNPPVDSEAVVAYMGSSRDHGVVIATDSGAYRVSSDSGEVVIHSQFGQTILLKNDGSVEITAPGGVDVGNGTSPVALSTQTDAKFQAIVDSINSAAVGSADGGAAFKANLIAALNIAFNAIGHVDSSNLRAD